MSARPDMITVCTVRRVSRVQFLDILLCKSAIRRLFFPSCSIVVFCTLSRLFVPFGLDSGFRLLGVRFAVRSFAFGVWAVTPACCRATLTWEIRNRKKTDENQNPESSNQRKQVPQILENLLCRAFAFKLKTREPKSPQTKIPCLLKFVQPLFLVRAMIMRIEIKCVNDSKHPESVSKQPAGY